RLGMPELRTWVAFACSDLARLDGDLATARAELALAAELCGERGVAPQLRALVASGHGDVSAAAGDLDAARAHHAEAMAQAQSSMDAPVIADVLVGVADLAMHEGDPARAATALGASLAIRGAPDLSLPDAARITTEARAALGDAGFAEAFER